MHEETTGLRILGSPIGSAAFCKEFHLKKVKAAMDDAAKILNGLSDKQTMLRIFKTCTLHKVTHLFASDVLNSPLDSLTSAWYDWKSDMTEEFSAMLDSFMARLLGIEHFPQHAHIISTISIANGGLGLQHPRLNAIPSAIISTKRAINYANNGIFLPGTTSACILPPSITTLYKNWDSPQPTSATFAIFNKYVCPIISAAVHDNELPPELLPDDAVKKFINNTSIPWAREQIKFHAGKAHVIRLINEAPEDVLHAIPGLLLPHMSLPLVAMSRSNSAHRLDNKDFNTALRVKLRVGIYHNDDAPICFCGKKIDKHLDHYFTCG